MDLSDEYTEYRYQLMLQLEMRHHRERADVPETMELNKKLLERLIDVCDYLFGGPSVAFRAMDYYYRFRAAKFRHSGPLLNEAEALSACFVIASKYESYTSHWKPTDIDIITGITPIEIARAERRVLETLRYELSSATALDFFRAYAEWFDLDVAIGVMLCKKTLLHKEFRPFLPSLVAAACATVLCRYSNKPWLGSRLCEPWHQPQFDNCLSLVKKLCY